MREPLEPLSDPIEVEVRAGGTESLDELVLVGGDDGGGVGREGDAAGLAPIAEPAHGPAVRGPGVWGLGS